jgi:ribosomal protein L37AE/L43A
VSYGGGSAYGGGGGYGREPFKPRCPECGSEQCYRTSPDATWNCYGCSPYGRPFRTRHAEGQSRAEKLAALEVAKRNRLVSPGTIPEDEG